MKNNKQLSFVIQLKNVNKQIEMQIGNEAMSINE